VFVRLLPSRRSTSGQDAAVGINSSVVVAPNGVPTIAPITFEVDLGNVNPYAPYR
jgi:hypothetical protein